MQSAEVMGAVTQIETATLMDLRDSLASRWHKGMSNGTHVVQDISSFPDPLENIPTGFVLAALEDRIPLMDPIELYFTAFTLTRLGSMSIIPLKFQDNCISIVKKIRNRQHIIKGRAFPVKKAG